MPRNRGQSLRCRAPSPHLSGSRPSKWSNAAAPDQVNWILVLTQSRFEASVCVWAPQPWHFDGKRAQGSRRSGKTMRAPGYVDHPHLRSSWKIIDTTYSRCLKGLSNRMTSPNY